MTDYDALQLARAISANRDIRDAAKQAARAHCQRLAVGEAFSMKVPVGQPAKRDTCRAINQVAYGILGAGNYQLMTNRFDGIVTVKRTGPPPDPAAGCCNGDPLATSSGDVLPMTDAFESAIPRTTMDIPAPPKPEVRVVSVVEPILQFFAYAHLPPHLQAVSMRFYDLAQHVTSSLPRNPERSVALRKLLEAKDAAVRARLFQ